MARLFSIPDQRYLSLTNNTGWRGQFVPHDWDLSVIDCRNIVSVALHVYTTNQRSADALDTTLAVTIVNASAAGVILEAADAAVNALIASLKNGAVAAEYVAIGSYSGAGANTITLAQGQLQVTHKQTY